MMRKYLITYKELKKYGSGDPLHRTVIVSKVSGDTAKDAKAALGVFIASTGTLKRNEIISIQELGPDNKPFGEPIVPMGENSIIPLRK
jgi:hypothetical protein